MSYVEVINLHPKLGKLLEEDAEIGEKATKEFASKHGVSVEDILSMRVSGDLLIGMNRYKAAVSARESIKRIPNDVIFERIDAGGVESEWIYVPEADENKIWFHLFGGGYIMGNLDIRKWSPYLYSKETNMRSLNVGYRLAPEHPYPAALEDSISAYKWLLDKDVDPKNVVICGESAGGGLTMATLLKLRELELPFPAAAVMQSPWVDLRCRGKSLKKFAYIEPDLATGVRAMASLYAGNESRKNPFISPVYADLAGLPPLLIQAGGIEVLVDEIKLLAERATSAGVETTLEVYKNMTHVFQSYADRLEESKNAWRSIASFARKFVN